MKSSSTGLVEQKLWRPALPSRLDLKSCVFCCTMVSRSRTLIYIHLMPSGKIPSSCNTVDHDTIQIWPSAKSQELSLRLLANHVHMQKPSAAKCGLVVQFLFTHTQSDPVNPMKDRDTAKDQKIYCDILTTSVITLWTLRRPEMKNLVSLSAHKDLDTVVSSMVW
ncbi:hypothetical protein HDV63DRAFT_388470 [Trichoderma sp. SZMC 28014]